MSKPYQEVEEWKCQWKRKDFMIDDVRKAADVVAKLDQKERFSDCCNVNCVTWVRKWCSW